MTSKGDNYEIEIRNMGRQVLALIRERSVEDADGTLFAAMMAAFELGIQRGTDDCMADILAANGVVKQ